MKPVNEDYFYNEVTYDYELLEDYQDIYSEFHESSSNAVAPSQQETELGSDPLPQGRGEGEPKEDKEVVSPYQWGPERYTYSTHPLYLMVRTCKASS